MPGCKIFNNWLISAHQ